MSKAKIVNSTDERHAAKRKEWPVVVIVWTVGLLFLGYVIGRIVLDAYPHPYHWASGLLGGTIGLLVGWIWFKKRGDIL